MVKQIVFLVLSAMTMEACSTEGRNGKANTNVDFC